MMHTERYWMNKVFILNNDGTYSEVEGYMLSQDSAQVVTATTSKLTGVDAMRELKNGKKIRRAGWGDGEYIYILKPFNHTFPGKIVFSWPYTDAIGLDEHAISTNRKFDVQDVYNHMVRVINDFYYDDWEIME